MGGRRLLRDEVVKSNVIDLAWRTLWRALRSGTIDIKTKIAIARDIASRTVPQEHKLTVDRVITYISNIEREAIDITPSKIDVTPEKAERIPVKKTQAVNGAIDTTSD